MNAKVIIDALVGFIIFLATPVLALLSQPGVNSLSQISQAAYVAAFLGALLATAKLIQSKLSDSPANVAQTNEIVKAAANLKMPTVPAAPLPITTEPVTQLQATAPGTP